jgi:hypothetical protein
MAVRQHTSPRQLSDSEAVQASIATRRPPARRRPRDASETDGDSSGARREDSERWPVVFAEQFVTPARSRPSFTERVGVLAHSANTRPSTKNRCKRRAAGGASGDRLSQTSQSRAMVFTLHLCRRRAKFSAYR